MTEEFDAGGTKARPTERELKHVEGQKRDEFHGGVHVVQRGYSQR